MDQEKKGLISIIMPVYKAAAFLDEGLKSIEAQGFTNWELIAVDDESPDNSDEIIKAFAERVPQHVEYTWQENKGGFGARNTGIDLATGEYIAFFDCDDLWYPDHLEQCVRELEQHADVDWVFGANRIVDLTRDVVVQESNFFEQDGSPRPLLELNVEKRGSLSIIRDERAAAFQIMHGLNVGQQFSVLRKRVFDGYRFRASYRNEGADQVSVIRSLKKGFVFGYLTEIQGSYAIHDNNASAGCKGGSSEKYMRLRKALIRGFEELESEIDLNEYELSALNRRLAKEHFWDIGYNILYQNGETKAAIEQFQTGLGQWPWDMSMWRTYVGAQIKRVIGSDSK